MKKYAIIIVENDEDEQFFMRQGFEKSGLFDIMDVLVNGDALFDKLSQSGDLPEIILSDLNMPGKNGYDIILGINQNPLYQKIPVVITSTSNTPSTKEKCLNQGAAAYIVKPDTFIDYEPFAVRLHEMLADKIALT